MEAVSMPPGGQKSHDEVTNMEFKETRPLYLLGEIASILRGEDGCAWDREQTPQTLKPYLIEEAYELYDAIDKEDPDHIREELGDLLFQVYIHAQIAKEKGLFTIDDVASDAAEKLIRRHPHVFGDDEVKSASEVIDRWEKIKKKEKPHRESILDGVPRHLPALLKAYRVQQKVSRVGFDWESSEGALEKLEEEVSELREAASSGDRDSILEESGDMLFSTVNILRHMGINPEDALIKSTEKFIRRYKKMESIASERGLKIEDLDIKGMDSLWEESKNKGL
ncbi:MAG: nucleoside triphosphate pyrophosphohydrolase [Spirochaetes bacterium]|jgi:MazG family protein|nr:nucleoside triphosphate pyrophosphohydrolase [Spirochaetota bacterium]